MIRIFFVDIGRAIIAENGEEEEEIGGESSLKTKDEANENEYIKEQGDDENAPLEGAGMCIEVQNVYVGFGGQGIKEGR